MILVWQGRKLALSIEELIVCKSGNNLYRGGNVGVNH